MYDGSIVANCFANLGLEAAGAGTTDEAILRPAWEAPKVKNFYCSAINLNRHTYRSKHKAVTEKNIANRNCHRLIYAQSPERPGVGGYGKERDCTATVSFALIEL